MSRDHGPTRNPNVAAWRTSSTTLALWIVFLLGRQGALLLLMAVHYDLSVIAIVGIILFIGIVKKTTSCWSILPSGRT
jgi:multidrug efflux pump subunit AcrB